MRPPDHHPCSAQERKLAFVFATWKTARVTRMDEGFRLSLEDGTLDDFAMHINTGNEKKDLKLIGFVLGSRRVQELYCPGDVSIFPREPTGKIPPPREFTIEEESGPPDPAILDFLKKNNLVLG